MQAYRLLVHNNMFDRIFIFSLIFFGIIVIPNSYAITYNDDIYKIIGRTLSHNPTICAFEPETNIKDGWKKLSLYTRDSIIDWEHKLNNYVRAKDTWQINYQPISLEKQQVGFTGCDITIHYFPKPELKEEEFEVAGRTFGNAINDQEIIIYYLNIELERVDYTEPSGQAGFYYSVVKFIPSYADYLAPESQLRVVIRHEIGHALGLGHYISEDEDRIQKWIDGAERPPSVMLPTRPTKVISADITPLDIEKIIQIYGRYGFYSKTALDELREAIDPDYQGVVLPDWIRNNAKWWSDGIISDKDFASGIEFMIKNQIIDVGVRGTNDFSVDSKIPEWVKSNAKWWSEGLIPSGEFVKGLQFLVKAGIIQV